MEIVSISVVLAPFIYYIHYQCSLLYVSSICLIKHNRNSVHQPKIRPVICLKRAVACLCAVNCVAFCLSRVFLHFFASVNACSFVSPFFFFFCSIVGAELLTPLCMLMSHNFCIFLSSFLTKWECWDYISSDKLDQEAFRSFLNLYLYMCIVCAG